MQVKRCLKLNIKESEEKYVSNENILFLFRSFFFLEVRLSGIRLTGKFDYPDLIEKKK